MSRFLPRRNFLKSSLKAGLTSSVASIGFAPLAKKAFAANSGSTEPHYFLHLVFPGGADPTYLFDARPLMMTDKGKIQNYGYKNVSGGQTLTNPAPLVYTGSNGHSTLRSPITEPLMKYASDFSVLNGVMMLGNDFGGHGQNMYFMFTGSPFNGESFMPVIGNKGQKPLENVQIGSFAGDGNQAPSNFSGSVVLNAGTTSGLAKDLQNGPQLDLNSSILKQITKRLEVNAAGLGMFSRGSEKMLSAMQNAPDLAKALQTVPNSSVSLNGVEGSVRLAMQYFVGGVTSAFTIMMATDPGLDVHGGSSAQGQVSLYQGVAADIATLFRLLKETPFDATSGKSMLDVTTVLVSSEFSRTMRQEGAAIDQTGTDHNPCNNSILIGGKGIVTGQVIGSSDLDQVNDTGEYPAVSPIHKASDPSLLKIFGKPFDFANMMPRADLPTEFKNSDYLTYRSIVNTVETLFGVEERHMFKNSPTDTKPASILKSLLKA